jgi:hypothetical protein
MIIGMDRNVASMALVDLKRVESFLLNQDEVLDASVWWDAGELVAHVTVHDVQGCQVNNLSDACGKEIGTAHQPDRIMVVGAKLI